MRSMQRRIGWASLATFFSAAAMAAGLSLTTVPAQAAFELPEGEKITNVPAIPRAIPQKEAYELYDPKIGKNFDIKNFWIRADVRVRPEMRTNSCFGSTFSAAGGPGACNSFTGTAATGNTRASAAATGNDQYVQQWVRLGIGYDLSPDVNFYMEIIDSAVWGANTGPQGDSLNHNGSTVPGGGNGGRLGVRAAYMLIRNFAGIQGFSVKAGRQYIIFGNHSLFGHFDWANTGYSHDGIMLQYSTKAFDSYLGWVRTAETDLGQAAPVGSLGNNVAYPGMGASNGANSDGDMIIFYNQIKSVPGFLIEPYYIYYSNRSPSAANAGQGFGTAKHSNQQRSMVGNRIEMRKGNFDFTNEIAYQFGRMGDGAGGVGQGGPCAGNNRCAHINAWATRNWVGYTAYNTAWKPRLAFNFDYASGDGRNNCAGTTAGVANGVGGCGVTANTFENFYPTNHIHMGYMDVQAWKNMMSPSVNLQARPTATDHVEFWWTNLNLANSKDNWYRGAQGVYVYSQVGNTSRNIGNELDFSWTKMFMDGKVSFQATYGYLMAGKYIEQNLGTSSNQSWAYVQLWMNF